MINIDTKFTLTALIGQGSSLARIDIYSNIIRPYRIVYIVKKNCQIVISAFKTYRK